MAHGGAREGKWRGKWRMEWVSSALHTTSEHGVSSITTADAHNSAAISRLNWRPRRFKWTRPFRQKTKSGFCACAITFQLASTYSWVHNTRRRNSAWLCPVFAGPNVTLLAPTISTWLLHLKKLCTAGLPSIQERQDSSDTKPQKNKENHYSRCSQNLVLTYLG